MTWVLSVEVQRVADLVRDLPEERCVEVLEQAYADLEHLRPEEVDPVDLEKNGPETARAVFLTQLLLHERLAAWWEDGQIDPTCMRSVRRADLAGRYLIDYLTGAAGGSEWLVNPAFEFRGPQDLRTGDLLVTRGTAVSSAGIAHMGRIDSQFSHNVLVRIDPDTGEASTVEAYLEVGALTQSLDDLLEHGLGRIVVLRHPDPELAARAAEAAYERVHRGRRIDYDADFDYQDHTGLFCSEVPRWAFGELVGAPESLPIEPALTVFEREKNPGMFEAMGIPASVTSAPPDILYDPTLQVVAEWRDPEALVSMRHHDAAVESLMHWMEDLGYVLEPQGRHRSMVSFGLFVRRLPLLGGALKHKIHPRGDKEFLVASLALQEPALALAEDLEVALAGRDEPLTYEQLREVLEGLRLEDLKRYEADPKSARYHEVIHPREPQAPRTASEAQVP
jgi:hypothetical protein